MSDPLIANFMQLIPATVGAVGQAQRASEVMRFATSLALAREARLGRDLTPGEFVDVGQVAVAFVLTTLEILDDRVRAHAEERAAAVDSAVPPPPSNGSAMSPEEIADLLANAGGVEGSEPGA